MSRIVFHEAATGLEGISPFKHPYRVNGSALSTLALMNGFGGIGVLFLMHASKGV